MSLSLKIDRKFLFDKLKFFSSITSTSLLDEEIYKSIFFDASKDKIILYATDSITDLLIDIDLENIEKGLVEIKGSGSFSIKNDTLINLVSKSEDKFVEISTKSKSKINIKSEFTTLNVNRNEKEDLLKNYSSSRLENHFTIKSRDFFNSILNTKFSISNEGSRFALSNLCINRDNNGDVDFVSTNGKRLSLCKAEVISDNKKFNILVPKRAVDMFFKFKIIKDMDEFLDVQFNSKRIAVNIKSKDCNYRSSSVLSNGIYPNYNIIIPNKPDVKIKYNRKDLLRCLSIISSVLTRKEEVRTGCFKITEESTIITSTNESNTLDSYSEINSEVTGNDGIEFPININFNINYWIDMLRICTFENIIVKFTDCDSCVVSEITKDGIYLIMPISL